MIDINNLFTDDLLEEIEVYCKNHDITPKMFFQRAIANQMFLGQHLKHGDNVYVGKTGKKAKQVIFPEGQ